MNENRDVFLSHNSQDKDRVRIIADVLEDHGRRPWLDERQLKGGDLWIQELEQGIVDSASAVVAIGEHSMGRWQRLTG